MHMSKSEQVGILVGCNAPTIEGRAFDEYDHSVFVVADGSFTSLGSYYLWLYTNNELLRFVSYEAGLRLVNVDITHLTDAIFEKLYLAAYVKLHKLHQQTLTKDDCPITTSKQLLVVDSSMMQQHWFCQFIERFNAREQRQ